MVPEMNKETHHRHRESCSMRLLVLSLRHHEWQLQSVQILPLHSHADNTSAVFYQKRHAFQCDFRASHNKITFVFSVLIISHQHKLENQEGFYQYTCTSDSIG